MGEYEWQFGAVLNPSWMRWWLVRPGAGQEPVNEVVEEWRRRIRLADRLRKELSEVLDSETDEEEALRWMSSIDPQAAVGTRHHAVPKFVLMRWANSNGRVQVFSKVEGNIGVRNIDTLAIRDFYTIIDTHGARNSMMESILSEMEGAAARAISDLLSPFTLPRGYEEHVATLAQFAAFQVVRTPRYRREAELRVEWYAKTMASGRVDDSELRELEIVPHQNEAIGMMGDLARSLLPMFLCRPIALVVLDGSRLLLSDEPIVVNSPTGAMHHPDCFLTNEEIEARIAKEARKKLKRQKRVGRVIHFSSTVPRGLGVANEIVLPIAPSAALLWGPLRSSPHVGGVDRIKVAGSEADRFASLANSAISEQALDWIVSRTSDDDFAQRAFPELGPLMRVCDGENAASLAINETPVRIRPARLWSETSGS